MTNARTGLSYRQAAERGRRVLNGDWVIAVLTALGGGPLRSADLLAAINDVEHQVGRDIHKVPLNKGVFSTTLARMVGYGLLTRTTEPGPPRKVWYSLTPSGRALLASPVRALADWALEHQARYQFIEPVDGQDLEFDDLGDD